MTVYIEKPAVNLREELASLRNQGGYEERQFYFDGLVTNGTFDTDASGWSATNATLGVSSGELTITSSASGAAYANQSFSTEVGKAYKIILSYRMNSPVGSTPFADYILGTSAFSSNLKDGTNNSTASNTTETTIFVATTSTTYLSLRLVSTAASQVAIFDNISVFEVDANNDVVHRLPKGWVPLHVYEDGLLQREGAANDYEVVYDGFDYYVKPAVAPSATTQTCVIGVRK